ncbi:uncharacterized protein ARMOST_01390 [Armillaria ostoyae]|uniref:BTB domain-containing protein n=1 Tax=Armillaria ostoyae TaxID=47428 RepID=A0A284QP10_ARMOS|nr:uncharacterized protein ARMOST_01390 [Armillaria ostoyae]
MLSSRSSSSVVVLRSRSASRASSPSWRLPSGSPCAPPTCVLTPPPVRCPIPPPSVCQIPMYGVFPVVIDILISFKTGSNDYQSVRVFTGSSVQCAHQISVDKPSPSRSSISIRSRSASRSPRSFYVSTPSGRFVIPSVILIFLHDRSLHFGPVLEAGAIPHRDTLCLSPRPFLATTSLRPSYLSWGILYTAGRLSPLFITLDSTSKMEMSLSRLIERIQYKIHRHFLVMSSSVFADELPPSVTSKYLPSDVDKQAFELVLSLFYPKDCFSGHDIQSESDWHKVLIFACRYKMTIIRDMAVTKLPSLDPIIKAELAAKYGLKDWLVPAYTDLCIKNITARKGWSADEGKKIGLEGILALVELKQDIMDRLGEHLDREKVVKTVEEKLKGLNLI